jgi:hypothetical protein
MGCCHGNSIVSCHPDGTIVRFDCWESCGWDAPKDAYTCGTDGGADPTGTYPKECVFACKPDCVDAECGSDGCGGSCGSCGSGDVCVEGKCCAPSCPGGDWSCGPDGCGGSCGECPAGFWCTDLAKCAYGYGCAQMRSAGCQGCGCEDCVCGKDAYCCTDKWDWKCTYICQHDCGGCVPCSDEECPAPPGLPEKADTAETAGVVEGALIADEAGRDAPDDATSPPEPGGEAVPDHPVGPTEEDAHDATAADGPSTDGPAPDGPAASDIPGDPGPDGSARAAGGSGGCSLAGAARRHSPAPWALASLVLVAAAGALARPGRRRQ